MYNIMAGVGAGPGVIVRAGASSSELLTPTSNSSSFISMSVEE